MNTMYQIEMTEMLQNPDPMISDFPRLRLGSRCQVHLLVEVLYIFKAGPISRIEL